MLRKLLVLGLFKASLWYLFNALLKALVGFFNKYYLLVIEIQSLTPKTRKMLLSSTYFCHYGQPRATASPNFPGI